MAQLHGNGWSGNQEHVHRMAPMGAWAKSKLEENEMKNPIEVHGANYVAFCKSWAPEWIEDEDLE